MSREDTSMTLAQEREDAALEARQADMLEEVAGRLWSAEPDPCARYDQEPVPLSRALVDVVADLSAREAVHVAPHPIVGRPLVIISDATSARRTARCAHCDWTYTNGVKTDVEAQARYHRGQHRTGRTAVTR